MRSLRTSGAVGRAPGNRCLYPEADCLQPPLRSGFRQQLTPGVRRLIEGGADESLRFKGRDL
jgi:hypothetical protein